MGGTPALLSKPDKEGQEHWLPSLVPGGRYVLFTLAVRGRADLAEIAVLDLKGGEWRSLIRGGHAEYVSTGHMAYLSAGVLYAVRFDRERAAVLGDPLPIVTGIRNSSTAGDFAISQMGTLLVVPAETAQPLRTLAWIERSGQETPINLPPRMYRELRLSPDGRRVALAIADQESDVWIYDLSGGPLRRLSFGPSVDERPVWTADGDYIVFASTRDGGGTFLQPANGSGEPQRLTERSRTLFPNETAPDGAIFGHELSPVTNGDIARLPPPVVTGTIRSASQRLPASMAGQLLINTPFIEINPTVAPNGRYLAYQSNDSGADQIYVRTLPRTSDGLWQVSTDGGRAAAWSRSGEELFYLDASNLLTSVPVRLSGDTIVVGTPRRLLDRPFVTQPENPRPYDVSSDGQRFLVIKNDMSASPNLVVAFNWFDELTKKLPAR
jgi:serine/threonine-protein kinase